MNWRLECEIMRKGVWNPIDLVIADSIEVCLDAICLEFLYQVGKI